MPDALRTADHLCRYVASTPVLGDRTITISCGVAGAGPGDDVDAIVERADRALYEAKRLGRNRAEISTEISAGRGGGPGAGAASTPR